LLTMHFVFHPRRKLAQTVKFGRGDTDENASLNGEARVVIASG
jgi:hypothetical protein